MEILVFGAGAIGGYLGGMLALAGHQVTLVARPDTAAAINRGGLLIAEADKTNRAPVKAFGFLKDAFAGTPAFDLVILGMKSYDVTEAVDQLAAVSPQPLMVMTIQNGIGIEEVVTERFGAGRTLAGTVTIPISRGGPNLLLVEREGRGLGLAPVAQCYAVDAWVEVFRAAGIRAAALASYQAMKWSKAFLNIMGNATSAILNRPPAELYRMGAIFDLEMRMLQEMLAVMKQLGLQVINLPGAAARPLAQSLSYAPRFLLQLVFTQVVVHGRGDKMPSFHIDLSSSKGQSEVVYHNGAIAAAGQRAGLKVPVNRALNDVLVQLAGRKLDRGWFDGRPDRLLEVVRGYERDKVMA